MGYWRWAIGYWLLVIGDGLSVMGYVKAVRREKCTKNEKNEFFLYF